MNTPESTSEAPVTTELQRHDTLFSGRTVVVLFEDGTQSPVKVNQLRLAQYEQAFTVMDNEFELLGLICGHNGAWAKTLQPESYEALLVTAQEVNAKGFFSYAERQHGALTRRLNKLSPQLLQAASQAVASSQSSQKPRPRPA
jgi:hypothetical protein